MVSGGFGSRQGGVGEWVEASDTGGSACGVGGGRLDSFHGAVGTTFLFGILVWARMKLI